MTGRTLFEKIWSAHVVKDLGGGRAIIHVDRHMLHEETSRVAFDGLRKLGLPVRNPELVKGVVDHAVSTAQGRTASSWMPAEYIIKAMRENCQAAGIGLFDIDDPRQGISHVVAPELGVTLPGCTLVCGDSHTATNGGLGAWAWGVGTTEVRHVLANQAIIQRKPKTMRVDFHGHLPQGVFAKDLILALIGRFGIAVGSGFVVEYAGEVVRALPVEGRLTICNMSIELGAKSGLIAADDATIDFLADRPFAPKGAMWDQAVSYWRDMHSDADALFDRELALDCSSITPQVTWGTTPEDVIGVDGLVPDPTAAPDERRRRSMLEALDYMDIEPGRPLEGLAIDLAFIGSCTNSRLSDLEVAAQVVKGRKVAPNVRAIVVPGSSHLKRVAEARGLDRAFREAGFEWRESGCSMCVAFNGDVVAPGQRCLSTTNRNFEDRQGPRSRTHLASPASVAAAAINGRITDVRKMIGQS